jgi:hypothetical protein
LIICKYRVEEGERKEAGEEKGRGGDKKEKMRKKMA